MVVHGFMLSMFTFIVNASRIDRAPQRKLEYTPMTTDAVTPAQVRTMGATVSRLPPARQVAICTRALPVRDAGQVGHQGQTIVLSPSILADYRIYRHQVQAWKGRHRIIAIDGPGHGDGGRSPAAFSMHDCGQAMGEVLDTAHLSVVDDPEAVTALIDNFLQQHLH